VRRLLTCSKREGRELAELHDWTVLQSLHTFTTVASQEEYALPTDYLRLIRDTEWDRAQSRPLIGPISTQSWESIKSSSLGSGVAFRRFRIAKGASTLARKIYVEPTPAANGDTLAFWYVSSYWCADTGQNNGQAAWAADNDEAIVDADLLRLGTLVRFKRSMGFEYASEADEYARMLERKKSQDAPSGTLNLAYQSRLRLVGPWNVPETGFGAV
jgi:hypothetical protein